MKELSIEGKAKRYDEALERAKIAYKDTDRHLKAVLERIFPELKESEDEKIRKTLIRFHKSTIDVDGIKGEDIIAWLENLNLIKANSPQLGEQKTTDKVESKFHEGDWVILTAGELSTTLQIVSVDINKKLYWFNDSSYLPIVDEECLHHWTIQDAKGGDVLASGQLVFIFNVIHGVWLNCHCSVHNDGSLITDSYDLMIAKYFSEVHPATKKQRDTLEKAMADAGYTFDFEKKELKKIENTRPMLSDFFNAEYERGKADALNMEWSEEDKMMIEETLYFLREYQQSNRCKDENGMQNSVTCEEWLKSLKERYTWKPSEEQMNALKHASNDCSIAFADMKILATLYEQLKALHRYEQDT